MAPLSHNPSSRYKRFSREGFQPLAHSNSRENLSTSHTMTNPNDVTIDIPLTKITSAKSTGARKGNVLSPQITSNPDFAAMEKRPSHARHDSTMGFRRHRVAAAGKSNRDERDGSMNALGRFYDKVYHFSVITRYMLFVAPLAILIAVPIVIGATVAQPATIGGVRIVWFFTWIEVIWVSLWVSKLVSKFLPFLFQFVVGVVSSGTRKYSLVLTALEIPLSLVGWSICALTTFVPLMTRNPDQRGANDTSLKSWEQIIKNILFACLFSTLVLLGEKFLIQLISINYHRKQFDDKIKDSKRNIYLTGILFEASRSLFPMYCPEFSEYDYAINDVMDLGLGSRPLTGGHNRSGSQTPMRFIQNVGRLGDKVTAAFGNVAHEITGKQVFNPTSAHSVVIEALEKKSASEALAKRIWLSFVLEGREALYLDDIIDVLGTENQAEAEETFACLDLDGNGDISMDEMVLRIQQFGRDRASIANSMHDVDQAINVLDNLLCAVVFVVVIFIFVAWLNSNFTTTLATTGTALLSLSFVFAATAQEVLGSCIFLFVKHPYDVGDRVDISDKQYVVERISLLYTVFRCVANHKKTQVPNIVLNTIWIDNVSRSKAMREQLSVFISFDTTLDDIELLREEMTKLVMDKDNSRDFSSEIDIELLGIAEMNKMELKVEIRHKSNWANEQVRAARRNKFMCALVLALKKIPIYAPGGGGAAAGDKANPNYSVAISHTEAEENKAEFAQKKEDKRMVPMAEMKKQDSAKSSGTDFWNNDVEVKERAQTQYDGAIGGLKQRTGTMNSSILQLSTTNDDLIERQRSEDVEEVKNILRRESTTGRRKVTQHNALTPSNAGVAMTTNSVPTIPEPTYPQRSASIPTIPEPSVSQSIELPTDGHYIAPPPIPPQAAARLEQRVGNQQQQMQQTQTQPPRVSYYEDVAPTVLNTTSASQQGRFRSGSMTTSPQQYYPQGNAFAQQQQSSNNGSPPAGRKPVPGIDQMKGFLQIGAQPPK